MWNNLDRGQKVMTVVQIIFRIMLNLTFAVCGGFVLNAIAAVFCAFMLNIQFNLWCEEYEH